MLVRSVKYYFILIIIFIVSPGYSQLFWGFDDDFKGKIKSVKTITYLPAFIFNNLPAYRGKEIKVLLFTEDRLPFKHLKMNDKGDTLAYCLWEYDDFGRIKKQTDFRDDHSLDRTIEYSYKKNTEIEKIFFNTGKLYHHSRTEADSLKRYKVTYFIGEGKKYLRHYCIWNESFLPVDVESYSDEGKTLFKTITNYNEYKMIESERYWNSDSSTFVHNEYSYDNMCRISVIKSYDKYGKFIKLTNNHYDKYHNLVRYMEFYPESNEFYPGRIDYVYDTHGNWISKIVYYENQNGDESEESRVIRSFEYY